MITMYAPNVYTPWERDVGNPALRPIQPSLEQAKAVLDAEVEREGKPPLEWTDEFGGSSAKLRGDLAYEVIPVQVNVSVDDVVKARMSEYRG